MDGPHPNPLPEGEGTDPGLLERYTDLNLLGRIHNRLGHIRSMSSARHLGRPPLPLGEGWGEGKMAHRKKKLAT
ncbi:hypothetical protein DMX02_08455 [Pseudomonas jessenii]|nr:hypothetical protein DMX02_08455 [Pseudomonas jessenii]